MIGPATYRNQHEDSNSAMKARTRSVPYAFEHNPHPIFKFSLPPGEGQGEGLCSNAPRFRMNASPMSLRDNAIPYRGDEPVAGRIARRASRTLMSQQQEEKS